MFKLKKKIQVGQFSNTHICSTEDYIDLLPLLVYIFLIDVVITAIRPNITRRLKNFESRKIVLLGVVTAPSRHFIIQNFCKDFRHRTMHLKSESVYEVELNSSSNLPVTVYSTAIIPGFTVVRLRSNFLLMFDISATARPYNGQTHFCNSSPRSPQLS
jgi:hypothetical protein